MMRLCVERFRGAMRRVKFSNSDVIGRDNIKRDAAGIATASLFVRIGYYCSIRLFSLPYDIVLCRLYAFTGHFFLSRQHYHVLTVHSVSLNSAG